MSNEAAVIGGRTSARLEAMRGPAALMTGAISFSAMAISVRFVTDSGVPAGEVVMIRFLMGLVTLEVLRAFGVIKISHRRWRTLSGRGITGSIAILFYFLSIQHTTLTKATLLSNAYPVFATMLGIMALGETMRWSTMSALVLSGFGMWLVAHPSSAGWSAGDIYGILGAATAGMAIVFIRHLRQTENPFSIFWYLCAYGSALGALTCVGGGGFAPLAQHVWVWLLVMGVSSTAGQLLITYGFGYMRAGEGSLISMSTVAYSGLFAWFVLGERMPLSGVAGAALILASAAYLAVRRDEG